MEIILFVVGSVLEYMAIFAFLFSLFKSGSREYFTEIFISCLMLTFVSFAMRYGFQLEKYSSFVQIAIFSLLLRSVFHFHLLYSILLSSIYVIYGFWQVFVVLSVLEWLNIVSLEQVLNREGQYYVLQAITILSVFFMAKGIRSLIPGFDIPHGKAVVFKNKMNFILLGLVVSLIFIFSMGYYLLITGGNGSEIIVMLALSLFIIIIFSYIIARRAH
ncbi:hypothetical protein [Brevibacillus reuszeri]|uniref:hypothetical protein n=1 Tax=Brevibacillus reuszeri TaxID=54915 RepID=UPI003D25663F